MHRSQKCKKDSPVKQLFVLLGHARVKAERKNIDEIDLLNLFTVKLMNFEIDPRALGIHKRLININ